MSGGDINPTELVAAIINQKENLIDGIRYAQELIDGSMTLLLLTPKGIYAARDKMGRTPVIIGRKEDAYCVTFESFAYLNLGYESRTGTWSRRDCGSDTEGSPYTGCSRKGYEDLYISVVYYGYPSSVYEGVSVEQMRCNCGACMAKRDDVTPDTVAGVPDSGIAHAVGYANESGIPFSRPFIKYTPTWPRSFMPTIQDTRNLIAHMKLIPIHELIQGKSLLLIDDSIVRGTQLRETTEFLYESGAKEVHIRPACPPLVYGCKYLNFSRSKSDMDLITRKVIQSWKDLMCQMKSFRNITDPSSEKYEIMVEEIRKELNFTSLKFNRLDDLLDSVGIDPDHLCTYCWNGKE